MRLHDFIEIIYTVNLPIKMTSNWVSSLQVLFFSLERPFLYRKAFLKVGSSKMDLPFTKSWLAENLS